MTRPLTPHVSNETSRLRAVVVGLPDSLGGVPTLEETYDAKSYVTIEKGVFPTEEAVQREMEALLSVLRKYEVEVLRPQPLKDYNQVFARDVAFAIEDKLFISNLLPDRERETAAMQNVFDLITEGHLVRLPEEVHAEGGDVLLYDDILFIGTYWGEDYSSYKTARTNRYAVDFFRDYFPEKRIVPLELIKHDRDPYRSILHLDCTFQPVGKGKAIYYPGGFLHAESCGVIEEIFGKENLFEVNKEEADHLTTNAFSISPEVVVLEERFERLAQHLTSAWGITVEKVPYYEVSKMGGLLRCSTMPLVRDGF